MMTHSTDATAIAQDRLLEAIAAVEQQAAGGIPGIRLAMPIAVQMAEDTNQRPLANMWRRLDELLEAVHDDLNPAKKEIPHV